MATNVDNSGHYFIFSYDENGGSLNVMMTAVAKMFKLEIWHVGNQ
jgi:hypothetical protein